MTRCPLLGCAAVILGLVLGGSPASSQEPWTVEEWLALHYSSKQPLADLAMVYLSGMADGLLDPELCKNPADISYRELSDIIANAVVQRSEVDPAISGQLAGVVLPGVVISTVCLGESL